ncbi:beta-lactamase family protein [Brevibacillus ruminantium]|uniref:Beta-lactamase family protein n=1 Tax=Brevibacillus ruminantium TaxID=2950604 RepID=A0ABY4WLW7_9BACL|nr:serine hydrolase domain-containing protein [Brevibacillus ruminantium]USG67052.1 beta-lactamase family protein [Brevibacillus ruminantium]
MKRSLHKSIWFTSPVTLCLSAIAVAITFAIVIVIGVFPPWPAVAEQNPPPADSSLASAGQDGRKGLFEKVDQYMDVASPKLKATGGTMVIVEDGNIVYTREWGAACDGQTHVAAQTKPGEWHQYSNANYGVLGALIEQIYGVPFDEYMDREVFQKLDLKRAAASVQQVMEKGLLAFYGLFSIPL